jgi:hypothetical protein
MNTVAEELTLAVQKAESCKFNTLTCSCLAQVLAGAAKALCSAKTQSSNHYGFLKLVHDCRKWMDLNTRPAAGRVPRRALHNIWSKVNSVLGDIALEVETKISTASPALIEQYWEQDVINQMIMKDLLCLVIWIQHDTEGMPLEDATESFINRFDNDNVTVFRVSSLCMMDRLEAFAKQLSGAKFDGRIRLVVSTKDPVSSMKRLLTVGFLRRVPILVNMSGVDTPEDSIGELIRLKADVQFSIKPTDFDKYCAFATVLWINYQDDPSRTIIEKKVAKTGVVIQKTDSMEKGLRYMDAHGHLAYLHDFRIIIGNGTLVLDETTEAAAIANKKRMFFAQRAAGARAGKIMSKSGEEAFSTLETVQVVRNRQKWHTPILVYSYDASPTDPALYAFKNLKSTTSLETLEYFASMKALPWAMDLSALRIDANSGLPGFLKIVNLRCNDLVPKKSGASMDPYVVVKVGDSFEKKTKRLSSTVNPTWNLGWEIACRLTDRIFVQVVDKSLFGKHDFEGTLECSISDLIPVATPFVEVTKVLEAKTAQNAPKSASPAPATEKSVSVALSGAPSSSAVPTHIPGTVTLELGFRFEGQREQGPGRVFGQPLESSLDDSIRNAHRHLIEDCILHIRQCGLECEGIFRQPTNQKRVDALKSAYDKAGLPSTVSGSAASAASIASGSPSSPPTFSAPDLAPEDPFDVAFLLRTYLKELPSPLIPRTRYEAFKACAAIEKRRERLVALSGILDQLSQHVLEAFAGIIHLLSDISKHELINKMTARNLATVLGPALAIPRDVETDPSTYLSDTTAVTTVLETCILYYHKLFQHHIAEISSPEGASSAPAKKRSSTASSAISVRALIDPYLTDSLSSPRHQPSTTAASASQLTHSGGKKNNHVRAQSDSVDNAFARSKKSSEWLQMDFQLDAKLVQPKGATEDEESEEYEESDSQPLEGVQEEPAEEEEEEDDSDKPLIVNPTVEDSGSDEEP